MEINDDEVNHGGQPPHGTPRVSRSPINRHARRPLSNVSSCSTKMHQRSFANFWSVENFAIQLELHTPGEFMLAPKFGDSDYEFVMKLFPNGKDDETAGYLSLFLLINKCPNPRLRFRVSFTVETADGPRSCHLNKNLVTINRSGIVTASKFFSLDILKSATNVYTPNDILTIGVELTVFGEALTWTTNAFNPYSRGPVNVRHSSVSSLEQQSSMKIEEGVQGGGFSELLNTGDFSDFTVVASCGREFATHMCVLSARSEYFKALLRNQSTTEYTSKRVTFEDISATTLDILLRHMYSTNTEHLVLEESHLTPELVSAVDRLMINSMRPEIAQNLTLNVTAENVVSRIGMAAELRIDSTYHALLEYFASHKKEAMQTSTWAEMRAEKPSLTIKILEEAIIYFDETNSLDRRIIDRITLS